MTTLRTRDMSHLTLTKPMNLRLCFRTDDYFFFLELFRSDMQGTILRKKKKEKNRCSARLKVNRLQSQPVPLTGSNG